MDPNETQEIIQDQQDQQGQQEGQQQAAPPEQGQQGAEGSQEGQQGQQEPPKAPERPKHWGDGKQQSQAVPIDRFNEVNNRAKAAEAELAATRARLAELDKARAPQADSDDPETIDPAKFTSSSGEFDGAAYMRERDRRVAAQATKLALESVDRRLSERDSQRQQAETVGRVVQDFRGQVAEVSKTNPQVAEAVDYLDSIADYIQHPVQMAILRGGPEVAHAIALDPSLVERMVRGNPADSIMEIGEIAGRIKYAKQGAVPPSPGGGIPAFQPGGAPAPRPQAPAPRTLPGGGGESVSRLSHAEYMRRRERGEL